MKKIKSILTGLLAGILWLSFAMILVSAVLWLDKASHYAYVVIWGWIAFAAWILLVAWEGK